MSKPEHGKIVRTGGNFRAVELEGYVRGHRRMVIERMEDAAGGVRWVEVERLECRGNDDDSRKRAIIELITGRDHGPEVEPA